MKKVAIVGSNSRTRSNAPFDDLTTEIWLFNEAAQQTWMTDKRWNVLFQLHKPEVYRSTTNWVAANHWEWLQAQRQGTIYMQDIDPDVPCSAQYPLDEILENIPGADMRWHQPPGNPHEGRRGWFDLSAAYALALALHQGYQEIDIYGMDLESNTEYSYQLGCWRFWVGIALGMGVNLTVHCSANDFGNGKLYAYDGEIQLSQKHFKKRRNELDAEFQAADAKLHQTLNRVKAAMLKHDYAALAQGLILDYQNESQRCGVCSGALAEATAYAKRKDPISRQEFERRAAQAQLDGEELRAQMYFMGGKTEYVFNIWRQTGRTDALNQLQAFMTRQMQLAYDSGARLGIYQENIRYIREYDELLTAAGGQKTVAALTAERTIA